MEKKKIPSVIATRIIENLTIFVIFAFFKGLVKIFIDFLEIKKILVNKKYAIYKSMAKSQFSLNSNFLKNYKNPRAIFRGFSLISPKVLDRNL